MSTDTAFALGALALAGKGLPDRVRTYLLTFAVVDDLGGIVVIAVFYSSNVRWMALVIGALLLVAYGVLSQARDPQRPGVRADRRSPAGWRSSSPGSTRSSAAWSSGC